jgi:hypothetical protein
LFVVLSCANFGLELCFCIKSESLSVALTSLSCGHPLSPARLFLLEHTIATHAHTELSTLDEVNRTRREYKEEISRPDGTPIPAFNRKWPHIILDTINNHANERAIGILSVVRKYKYIENSPSHTKAFAISQRGYVEHNKKGLTEFEPMPDLNITMMQYTMAKKLTLFSMFREYKALRQWDFAVRRRKFNDRKAVAEKRLLQARREHWACVQHVMSACVQLTEDVQEKELRAPPTGWGVEQMRDEFLRHKF